jgi:membrane protease YdiL (CAAX protease family)
MTEVDHFFAAAIAVMTLGLLFRKAPPPTPDSRGSFYLSAAATGAVLGAVVLLLWHFQERSIHDLGLYGWAGYPTLATAGAVGWVLLLILAYALVKQGHFREGLERIYEKYEQIMPRTRGELTAALGVSTTAGFGEELVFRGFLLWYGTLLVGLPASVIGTSLLFGIAHGYQSRFGVIFASIAGLVLAGAYLASGSLLLVMWMHATYDMWSFTTARLVLSRKEAREGLGSR